MQGVPDCLSGWEDSFAIPKQFSEPVMCALSSKEITDNIRSAIVRDVATLILNHCKYPTVAQCDVVASKIVKQWDVLEDTLGTGHVSYTFSIITAYLLFTFI